MTIENLSASVLEKNLNLLLDLEMLRLSQYPKTPKIPYDPDNDMTLISKVREEAFELGRKSSDGQFTNPYPSDSRKGKAFASGFTNGYYA